MTGDIENSVCDTASAAESNEIASGGRPKKAKQPANHFAHHSEEEFARILDFYQLQWEYEPRTFPLEFDADGTAIESFTPDFYLPAFDLYIELTTLKQSLVTKKNRKLRRLRELYPEVNIKLFYGRDFRRLMAKYDLGSTETAPPDGNSG